MYDRYGEWVPNNSDVDTSPDQTGMDPADLDTPRR
jgi:hypothetical protein